MTEAFDDLLDDAEAALSTLGETDSLDELADEDLDALLGNLEAVEALLAEVDDILESIDFSDLPEAVDAGAVLEAIHAGEIPSAVADGEADEAVEVRKLVRAIELTELWDSVDLGDLWESKRDLEDAVDDVDDEGGLVGEAADAVTDDEADGDGDDGLLAEAGDEFADQLGGEFGSLDPGGGDGIGLDAEDTEAYETMIQQTAMEGIDAFREALIVTHGEFQKLYEENRERMRRQDRATNSRNPTAVSTVPLDRTDVPSTARYSTIPRKVRHSSGPTRKHIYGDRFERELERRREGGR